LEPLDFTEKTPVELTIEPLPQRSVVEETHGLIHIDPKNSQDDPDFPFDPDFLPSSGVQGSPLR
jgi:hypothetical protein